ncbi:hypothetical protein AB8Z38_18150 [Bradyrhizobium sp. LLZ17]|uniref:Carrier domain-containing protein n=1 Tax=Bradyrhizobium sp. LLZ17 TaxID=3239388 RepID=A0AB39XTD3_9BRAD
MPTAVSTTQSAAFPAMQVEACIRDTLAVQAADQAILRPRVPQIPGIVPATSWEPEIDSLVAVEVICAVEELLGIKLPATFSPKGGYDSAEACVNDLLCEASAAWNQLTSERTS